MRLNPYPAHFRYVRHGIRGSFSSRSLLRCAGIALLLGFCSGHVGADIRETRHNLIKSGDKSVSEKQVCVFCHTPTEDVIELPDGSARTLKPSWQQSLANAYSFTIYDDIGRLGLGKPSVGSQSVACLSCHDSAQAFNVGRTSADHPFGVPYRGALRLLAPSGQTVTPKAESTTPFRAAQHVLAIEDFREASQGTIEGRSVFWVSRNGITARRSRGDLPLYGRATDDDPLLGTGATVPHIECSSCHDPHTTTQTFLRVSPEDSSLCLTCHDK